MEFRIADTFTDSLARLTRDEQKAVKTTAFDLQLNPANPGMQFHKLDRAKDKQFWSVRVSADVRLIVHRTGDGILLCYVGHHDDAYGWAERRRIERHPKTGAAQLVEIRETVRRVEVAQYIEASPGPRDASPPSATPALFTGVPDDELLGYGVPEDWLDDVRAATEDSLFDLSEHLPREAVEALFDLATGSKPQAPQRIATSEDPFTHPDAQRRFRVMTNVEELQRALEYPWDKWTVFLHPAQRDLVERRYSGPVRVAGSAGTGKTIVALHRAVHLARTNSSARVLLTTFSTTLANFLRQKLQRLAGNEPAVIGRIDVRPIAEAGGGIYAETFGEPRLAADAAVLAIIREEAAAAPAHAFSDGFLFDEWSNVVDAWQLETWEQYRGVARLGRKTRLNEKQRQTVWATLERVRTRLRSEGLVTPSGVLAGATSALRKAASSRYTFAVVDEAQDLTVAQLRFLAALAGSRPDALFFTGDLGQRIFQTPFSWKSLGVDIRGRSHTLRINYRTSHQIRRRADKLLPDEIGDVDGNAEQRRGAVSVFNGPDPEIVLVRSTAEERAAIGSWVRARIAEGLQPDEVGVFVRSPREIQRARVGVADSGNSFVELDSGAEPCVDKVAISTMHLAKGLEFRAVVVAAVDEGVLPLESRIEEVGDESDLEEVYNTERHLLYVACTRARDRLLIVGVAPGSEFLDDMRGEFS